MTLKHSQKMYLISPQQLASLSKPQTVPIRQSAREDLDTRMRDILDDPGLDFYEKAKKYEALLQKYLTLDKQEQAEQSAAAPRRSDPPEAGIRETNQVLNDILSHIPTRVRNNAEYVLKKLSEGEGGWASNGEFVYKGSAVTGSHIIDLVKQLTLPFKSAQQPAGWGEFLTALSDANLPLTSVTNPHARSQYTDVKSGLTVVKKKKNHNIILSPTWTLNGASGGPGAARPDGSKHKKRRSSSRRNIHPPKWLTFGS